MCREHWVEGDRTWKKREMSLAWKQSGEAQKEVAFELVLMARRTRRWGIVSPRGQVRYGVRANDRALLSYLSTFT